MSAPGATGSPTLLVHAGWPKTGTTSLQEWLRPHPNLAGAPFDRPGGARARDVLLRLWSSAEPPALGDLIAASVTDPGLPVVLSYEALVGLPSSWRLRGHVGFEAVARRLHEVSPDVRLLFTVRDGRDLLRSTFLHEVRRGEARPYAELIDDVGADRSGGHGPLAIAALLAEAEAVVGAQSIAVAPLDAITDDPARFWARLSERWAVPAPTTLPSGPLPRANPTVVGPPRLERALNRWVLRSYVQPSRSGGLPTRVRRPIRRATVNRLLDRAGRDWSRHHLTPAPAGEAELAAALQVEIEAALRRFPWTA